MGLVFRICLVALICGGLLSFSPPVEAGYWQQEAPYMISYDDKPCTVQKQWNDQGWTVRIDDFSSTHVTAGTYHPQVQPSWSQVKSWWQAPPAVLYPGQRITLQFGNQFIAQSKWTEAYVWLYRMSGPGGGDDQLGSSGAVKTSGTYTTKVHIVPDGYDGQAPEGVRLKYQMGATPIATVACKAVFPYRWISDKSNAQTAASTGETWCRFDNGRAIDVITIRRNGDSAQLELREGWNASVYSRGSGTFSGYQLRANLTATGAQTSYPVVMDFKGANMKYESYNPQTGNRWQGVFTSCLPPK